MALYCIGDIQGCHGAFEHLLHLVDFSASRDTLYILGDLVNRGPHSAQVLRTCMRAGDAVRALLGNHDLHLLARACGVRKSGARDTLDDVLQAPDCAPMLHWLRQQPLVRVHCTARGKTLLMVHAGVLPQWTAHDCLALAQEVQIALQSNDFTEFLSAMYGNKPAYWCNGWQGQERLRVIVNALTRLRFCSASGVMDFASAESAAQAPPGLVPWFDVPARASANITIAFGHWSTLGHINRANVVALDTGCVWGGCLSMMRFGECLHARELIQVPCPQAQNPA